MISLDEARQFVLDGCTVATSVTVPVDDARRLITASDLSAIGPIPPFDNTAMDGFALRSADVQVAPVDLALVGTIAAGAVPDIEVGPGQAVRIMTGAPIPPGADAIVMVELTEVADDGGTVTVTTPVPIGNHIRPAGDDVTAGQLVIPAGTELTAAHLGVCASIGVFDIPVVPRPRVGVLSTGDELVDSSAPLEIGQIRDSNRHTLLALVRAMGADGVDLGLVADDETKIREALLAGAATCDAVITSGGVSMGDFDFVKKVLSEIAEMRWMQVAIKPAKPLAFGTIDGTPIFGLPGNPVSSMVSFELFARPGIRKIMGHGEPIPTPVPGVAGADLPRGQDGKTHFARVLASRDSTGVLHVRLARGQGSHQLAAMASSNALAILPDGVGIEAGDTVDLLLLDV